MMNRLSKLKEDKSGRLAARMQILVAAIAEIQRFDQVVTVSQTLITMPSGQTQEVSTIHFGLGASYFVSRRMVSERSRWKARWELAMDLSKLHCPW